MAICRVNPFSQYVKSNSAGSGCNLSVDEVFQSEKLINDSIRIGGNQLKLTIRRLNLHPAHPVRKTLWSRLISAKYSVSLPSDDANLADFGPTTDADSSTSELAGYELSDQLLLPTFLLNEAGQKCLRDILHQIIRSNPELVYAPQLWPLLALFLHYHSAPTARACLLGLLRQPDLITQTKSAWIVHSLGLERLGMLGFVSKDAKRTTKLRLEQHTNEVRISLARWPIALWHLPFGYLVRLTDCFLVEGPKVFFRAGLLLWKLAARLEKSTGQSTGGSFDLLSTARNLNISASTFMRKLFHIRNLGRESVRRALETVRQSESSKSGDQSALEDALIHPCKRAGQTTYASYLVGDDRSSGAVGVSQSKPVHPSDCVTVSELATLITSIADNKLSQLSKPVLLFSTNRDGTSLRTMYSRAADALLPASLLLVRTRSGRSVIGAFCTDRWQPRGQPTYFGSGLSFLFRVKPGPLVIYPWVGPVQNGDKPSDPIDLFQYCAEHQLHVGGGRGTGSPGLSLDSQLNVGTSGPSPTFSSPCLITEPADMIERFGTQQDQGCSFAIGLVELIGFHDL
ncbi:Rab-gap/tbc [Fasciolopsis buskii]|uniref:Oxidation resistance protein 1 n=1 Tax=Fasciolopsis buskii TaxID=27845 RepID=A0A8E0RXP0_9TREM|nr:Rab-gap/tbc [Fasciolopsis buski]